MALGERLKACRQHAGMSQEKVAELVGVSRQAVTKWEANQSAPNTENLFKLAEIFGTTVDMLLSSEHKENQSSAEQFYHLYETEKHKKAVLKKQTLKRNTMIAVIVALGYIGIYFIGRIIWCDPSQSNLIGWLFTVKPSGSHSYLYGWLLDRNLFWYAMVLSTIPSLFGKHLFSYVSLVGFIAGLAAGIIWGPYPEGAAIGHDHYGWAIWGIVYLISLAVGIFIERIKKKTEKKPAE